LIDTNSISFIGSGNVANHLSRALQKENITISHIYSRNLNTAQELAGKINAIVVNELSDLPNQLTIVCVSDDSIHSVIDKINPKIPIAYTSGTVELSSFSSRENIGVFYPLQTFSKNREVDFFEVPIFIESNSEYFTSILFDLGWKVSREVNHASSTERKKMHIAAVMVNNFTNHIIHLAQKYSHDNDINFDYLRPLLNETVAKLEITSARKAQTGPARRGDVKIIEEHLKTLSGTTRDVYQLITKSIIETYKNNDKL
tara:strand:+ start:11514 stop:12287 length:774 start_codon:yes stop_codon:yes gene_type:complete